MSNYPMTMNTRNKVIVLHDQLLLIINYADGLHLNVYLSTCVIFLCCHRVPKCANRCTLFFQVTNYLQEIAPDLCDRVELFKERIPLFDKFNIEEEINSMLSKR